MSTRQPNTIDWGLQEHQAKRNSDLCLINYLIESGTVKQWKRYKRKISLVTLSADKLIFETEFLKSMPDSIKFSITPIERDLKVYNKLIRNLGELLENKVEVLKANIIKEFANAEVIVLDKPTDVSSYFSTKNYGAIDFIYLDYMGTWSREKESDLIRIFESPATSSKFILVMTIAGARGNGDTNKYLRALSKKRTKINLDFGEVMGKKETFDAKTKGVVVNILELGKQCNVNVIAKEFYSYPGIKNKPEYKFLFEVTKN